MPRPTVGIIPARYGSSRFPGKPLAVIGEKTLLHHVHDCALRCRQLDRVVVATDDQRILREVLAFGGTAVMTSQAHRSGTDRIAEALDQLGDASSLVVNIQGDEPFIDSTTIDAVASALRSDPASVWTAVAPFADPSDAQRESVVKAVLAADGRVLYFSRTPIPFLRNQTEGHNLRFHHVGIYGTAPELLRRFIAMPPTPLEEAEGLEQLRMLEAGIVIRAVRVEGSFGGVDTPEDLDRARRHWESLSHQGGDR